MPPKVSVVVPTYCSGPGLDAVMGSLVAQTLAKDEFEVVLVDDGSPDDTYDRLRAFADQYPWVRVDQIPGSGWPGRPRNVGVRRAAGTYVFFMDHDDYLFPDALRRMFDFAEANDLDIVHAKEVVDGWSTPAWRGFRTQIPRGFDRYSFDAITPHKLYRRSFLIEHDIWFREGPVRLEDIDFNVRAWMHTDAIGVMADYPAYKWILHADNSHRIASPTYWDDLRIAVQPLQGAEASPHDLKRAFILARIYRRQVLDRLGPGLLDASEERLAVLSAVLPEQLPHFPEDVDPHLDPHLRARSALLRRQDWTGLMGLARADRGLTLAPSSVALDWVGGQLELVVEGTVGHADGRPMAVQHVGTRIVRHLPDELAAHFRDGELDLTDDLARAHVEVVVRSRRDRVDWTIPSTTSEVSVQQTGDAPGHVRYRVRARIDPLAAAFGAALVEDRYDVFHRVLDLGYTGVHRVPIPADTHSTSLLNGLPVGVAASSTGFAVLDVGGIARAVARSLLTTPHLLTMSRQSASLEVPVGLPASGHWSREGALEVSVFGLVEDRWPATLRSVEGIVTLHAEGPTPPPGLHPVALHLGDDPVPIGWLSHERPLGRTATLRLLNAQDARARARGLAHDSRMSPAAKVRRRTSRALGPTAHP